jgi:hypothetical protein
VCARARVKAEEAASRAGYKRVGYYSRKNSSFRSEAGVLLLLVIGSAGVGHNKVEPVWPHFRFPLAVSNPAMLGEGAVWAGEEYLVMPFDMSLDA